MDEYVEDQSSVEYMFWQHLPTSRLLAMRYDKGISLRAFGMGWGGTAFPSYTYRSVTTINRILSERGV